MSDVHPFRGLVYAQDRVAIEKVVTEPYDKISPAMRDRYYERDPHNIVRIVFGRPSPEDTPQDNVYTRAAVYLDEWRRNGVLRPADVPGFWVYKQRFTIPGTHDVRERMGFIGLGRIEEYSRGVVFPHERTLAGPKLDRLELLRHTHAHFEQIFMLYEDPEWKIDHVLQRAAGRSADIDVIDERGVEHSLWMIDSAADVEAIRTGMRGKRLIIADGHHRYETALRFRDEMRATHPGAGPDAPFEHLPMTFFNMDAPGLTILATHRVISGLQDFDGAEFMRRAQGRFTAVPSRDIGADLERSGRAHSTIGVRLKDESWLLSPRASLDLAATMPDLSPAECSLDVVLLHRLLLERCLGITEEAVRHESHISYVRELDAAVSAVTSGDAQIAFLLNPTRIDQMRDIAYAGKVMPQKSTDFYPKVLSGLVIYTLEG